VLSCPSTFWELSGWLFQIKSGCSEALRECLLFSSPTGGHDVSWYHWCWWVNAKLSCCWFSSHSGEVPSCVQVHKIAVFLSEVLVPLPRENRGFVKRHLFFGNDAFLCGQTGMGSQKLFLPCRGNVERCKKL